MLVDVPGLAPSGAATSERNHDIEDERTRPRADGFQLSVTSSVSRARRLPHR